MITWLRNTTGLLGMLGATIALASAAWLLFSIDAWQGHCDDFDYMGISPTVFPRVAMLGGGLLSLLGATHPDRGIRWLCRSGAVTGIMLAVAGGVLAEQIAGCLPT